MSPDDHATTSLPELRSLADEDLLDLCETSTIYALLDLAEASRSLRATLENWESSPEFDDALSLLDFGDPSA